jgi:hypothetical protein
MNLSQIHIYRLTHIENIPHILKNGITHKNSPNAKPDYVTIGDVDLIETRAAKQVNISNGARFQSHGKITLGDFIPFYFGVRMPMLYVVQHGGNYVERATPKEDIVYLVCRLTDLIDSKATYYFSDGHATDAFTLFYDKSRIAELPTIIDWVAVKSVYWGGEENLETKRKKQAEFLVAGDIAPQNLCGFVCYNGVVKQRLIEMGVDSRKVKVYPSAYY